MMTRARKTSRKTTRWRVRGPGKHGEDGSYVGETSNDDAIDAGETGAEARAEEKG
jgi:hypothetical protein